MGWERCHTETGFAPLKGVRSPGGLPGWHLGLIWGWYLNLVIAEVGFSPRNMACYDDFAMLWMRKNLERKI